MSEGLTADEVKKGLECCIFDECESCPHDEETVCVENLHQEALDLINRYEEELENKSAALGTLLCHATGGKLSKDTYPMGVMERAVTDYIEDCCTEARAEEAKAIAEKLKEYVETNSVQTTFFGGKCFIDKDTIDNLLKERAGEDNADKIKHQ